MLYKNAEFHNVEEMITNEDGSVSFIRVPKAAYEKLEMPGGQRQALGSTGVEIRFVINKDAVKIKMAIRTKGDGTKGDVPFLSTFVVLLKLVTTLRVQEM